VCKGSTKSRDKRTKGEKSLRSFVISHFLCTFVPDNEPLKQAGGSASSALTIRISRQNAEIRRFPVRNLENRVISQTSDKQRKFEISSKVTKKRTKSKMKARFSFFFRYGVTVFPVISSFKRKEMAMK
jgi:hypothetical protein